MTSPLSSIFPQGLAGIYSATIYQPLILCQAPCWAVGNRERIIKHGPLSLSSSQASPVVSTRTEPVKVQASACN